MDITIQPRLLRGAVQAIPSKSQAHRYLICAALSDKETVMICPETCVDIEATATCLNALGASIARTDSGYHISPMRQIPQQAYLHCRESGSTLRFLLPIVGALGIDATFQMEGRLPERPLSPLWEEMERMGCRLSRPTENTIHCCGRLLAGNYSIDGSVSSQFITGLLFALSLIPGESSLKITGTVESKPYIRLTEAAMELFQAPHYQSPGCVSVEGDWSNGAFWLAAAALGNPVTVTGLNADSVQGDRAILPLLSALEEYGTIDVSDIPDLLPILAVTAAAKKGATFTNIRRLRLKESDRVSAIVNMITALGGAAEATENTLTVQRTGFTGGSVDAQGDHRIAMAAAIAATVCTAPVTIMRADAVSKSYPSFWNVYKNLGGIYEQHIR